MSAAPAPAGPHGDPVAAAAPVLQALSTRPRLEIMVLLDRTGPLRVTDIARALGMEIAHASQQLARLHAAGLLLRAPRRGAYRLAGHRLWEALRPLVSPR